MTFRSTARRRLEAAAAALSASLLSLALYWVNPRFLERMDATARDWVFQVRTTPAPSSAVAVVEIDEKALKAFGRWPWPRTLQARLIRELDRMGAAAIAIDMVYPTPERPDSDAALARALAGARALVVGGYFFRMHQAVPPDPEALALHRDSRIRILRRRPGARLDHVTAFPHVELSIPLILRATDALGFYNALEDADGIVRHAPLILRHGRELYPALSLAALAAALDSPPVVTVGPLGVESIQLAGVDIPVDEVGELALNFYEPNEDVEVFSAAEVLEGRLPAGTLRGRLVFLGVAELGVADVVPTPLSPAYPGIRVHATVASNILSGHFLRGGDHVVLPTVLMIVGLPLLLVVLLGLAPNARWMLVSALGVLAAAYALFHVLVARYGLLVSVMHPILALGIGFVAFQVYYVLTAQRTTHFLRRAFSSYVSPVLVDQLIEEPQALRLGGQRRTVTILFSDIRGFTTLSEEMDPEDLVELLNVYLDAMTRAILAHKGTLDKYIGDAIMAFFNAPVTIADHAGQAAEAALEMRERLEWLNVEFDARYGRRLDIGIGLHTGEAVVGNIGGRQRFDYTVIGDAVNLAARLESATRQYGAHILISQATRAGLDGRFVCRRIDRIRVKGKRRSVEIHELLARRGDTRAEELARRFEHALEAYFRRRFAEARGLFAELARQFDDPPSRVFEARCATYLQRPPPEEWTGVFVARSK